MSNVVRTWLRFPDVECMRCRFFCGDDGDAVYVIEGRMVCEACATTAEESGAVGL